VSGAAAVASVAAAVPALSDRDRTALALVALAGMPRPQVALRLGIGEAQLSESLARARKELRRIVAPLPGSGWCERAERLISDRIDGALAQRDEPRLDVHLRNCPRCVEHERRLVQATDALAGRVAAAPVAPAPVPAGEPAAQPEPIAIEPAPAPPDAPPPAAALERHPRRELASALSWNVLIVIAVVLALASLALALAGALGAQF
jgi:hypothetical protein